MDLLKPRLQPSFGWLEAVALGLYATLSGCVCYFHEPWSDEAQAWLIARDSSLQDIFLKRLHYEGTPGLWHLLLWVFTRLHLSFTAMHWATVLIGVAAAYVLLRYSPFPLLVRVALPFTFPFVFQTAIIARSYSLVPLLAFLLCVVLTSTRDRPLTFAVLLGLLANTSLFAFMLALGILPLYLLRLGREGNRPSRRSLLLSGTVLALLFLFAMYTALPSTDISFGPGRTFAQHRRISHLLSWVTRSPWPAPGEPAEAFALKPPSPAPAKSPAPRTLVGCFASHHPFIGHLHASLLGIASIAFYTVSQFNLLAVLFFAALLLWQWRHRALITLLPLLLVLISGQYLGMGDHHTSLVATALVIALWLTWSRSSALPLKQFDLVFEILLLAVLIEQIAWTAHAALYDIRQPFDGSINAAQFILPEAAHSRVASVGIDDLAIQPYATHNIFYNQRSTYWPWRVGFNPDEDLARTVAQHPDFILDNEAFSWDAILYNQIKFQVPHHQSFDQQDKASYLRGHGYRETHRFCGLQPAHFGFSRETCLVVYEPAP